MKVIDSDESPIRIDGEQSRSLESSIEWDQLNIIDRTKPIEWNHVDIINWKQLIRTHLQGEDGEVKFNWMESMEKIGQGDR